MFLLREGGTSPRAIGDTKLVEEYCAKWYLGKPGDGQRMSCLVFRAFYDSSHGLAFPLIV